MGPKRWLPDPLLPDPWPPNQWWLDRRFRVDRELDRVSRVAKLVSGTISAAGAPDPEGVRGSRVSRSAWMEAGRGGEFESGKCSEEELQSEDP